MNLQLLQVNIDVLNYSNGSSSLKNNFLEYAPIYSPLIVFVIFIVTQIITERNRKKDLKKAWYYKAILENGLEQLNAFFADLEEIVQSALVELKSSGYDPGVLIQKKAKIADRKRIFEAKILYQLQISYKREFKLLTDDLNNLQDELYKFLEDDEQKDPDQTFSIIMNLNKGNILKHLSAPAIR